MESFIHLFGSILNHLKRSMIFLAVCALIFAVTGCCSRYQDTSSELGRFYHSAFAAQVFNLDAPKDRSKADRLSGNLAVRIYKERYVKSMVKEKDEKKRPAATVTKHRSMSFPQPTDRPTAQRRRHGDAIE